MATGVTSKFALAAVAAVGLYVPTLGLPLPDSCMHTIGVAGAAPAPSRSCGGDLRECLRQSADLRQTTFGGRYVTAEDVARCVEAFNSCIHGGGASGNPPATSPARREAGGLPNRFRVSVQGITEDCRRDGDSVTCTTTLSPLADGIDTYDGTITGTISGMTLTGTRILNDAGHQPTDPSCGWRMESSNPVTLRFSPDGKVTINEGPGRTRQSTSGSCHGTGEFATPASESTGTWSASG